MAVRVNPISRGAALLIVVVGLVTYYYIDDVAGAVFVILGIALYWLLNRFTRRIQGEVSKAAKAREHG